MALVFLASFIAVLSMAVDRFMNPREMKEEVALFALIVNSFAVIVNYIQWRKNTRLSKQKFSLVMESQQYLFFIKFFTVLTVEISLSLYFLLQGKGIHDYIDTMFSVALAFLTLYSAMRLFRKSNDNKEKAASLSETSS
jgi:divalent metal cation (Fe/Co/Zn/Cd) transporter